MSTLLHFDSLKRTTLPSRPIHLAIGMFDGVHLGHQSVLASTVNAAAQSGGCSGVLTFWPHPSALFRPEKPTPLLMPLEMKRSVLGRLGLDFVIEENFSTDFARIEALEFLPYLVKCLPGLTAIYVGENWRFGRGRVGDVSLLLKEAPKVGLTVFSTPRIDHQGEPISSSRIRERLVTGDVAGANGLLGYAYFVEGVVQRGRQLGRTIGFPTLNIPWQPELKPRYGVYAVEVSAGGLTGLTGVANYGLRPTVGQADQPLLEVYLLNQTSLSYGDELTVSWLHFIRPERKFGGVEALRAQLALDCQAALQFFSDRAGS